MSDSFDNMAESKMSDVDILIIQMVLVTMTF